VRNIFDQYTQPENRVTHALVTALTEDRRLLREFVKWATGKQQPKGSRLQVLEQRLPGDPEVTEEEAGKRGLPDAWIFDDEGWALLIESKIAARISPRQLRRHMHTAHRRGFLDVSLLGISVVAPRGRPSPRTRFVQWPDVYSWLHKQSRQLDWARRAAEYLEVAERRFIEDEYLKEGALTKFSGIPFNSDYPYNYLEAKRLLRLAMDELRQRSDLRRRLGMDASGEGRAAIKGREGSGVWDYLSFKKARRQPFTRYPHLTLALQRDRLFVIVVIPNGAKRRFRRNLVRLGRDGFTALVRDLADKLDRTLRSEPNASPRAEIVQRHYPTQSSAPIDDARLEYDLRTLLKPRRASRVKFQPQWVKATYDVLCNKRSNVQLAFGAAIPYSACRAVATPKILDQVAAVWLACRPLLDVVISDG
jgi:hypothetical protein